MNIKKFLLTVVLLVLISVLVTGAGIYYVLFTASGSARLVKIVVAHYLPVKTITFTQAEGNLLSHLSLEKVTFRGIRTVSDNLKLVAQQLKIYFSSLDVRGLHVQLREGALLLPDTQIHVQGSYQPDIWELALESKQLDIARTLSSILGAVPAHFPVGVLTDFKLKIIQTPQGLYIEGNSSLSDIVYQHFLIKQGMFSVKLSLKEEKQNPLLKGTVLFTDLLIIPQETQEASISIQRLEGKWDNDPWEKIMMTIINSQLRFPSAEMILFQGHYSDSSIEGNLYLRSLDVQKFIELCLSNNSLQKIVTDFFTQETLDKLSGSITELDFDIKGSQQDITCSGDFQVQQLVYDTFSVKESSGSLDLRFNNTQLQGSISLEKGTIIGPKTATIQLKPSRIMFEGDPYEPGFKMEGISILGKTTIFLYLSGTLENPVLTLKSEPALPQTRLLLMVATGQSWKGTEKALTQNQIPADLVKEFLDYFVFAGKGSKFTEQLGITDVSIHYDEQRRGLDIKKKVADNLEACYGIEHIQERNGKPATTQKVGGEYKMTDSLSLEAEEQISQDTSQGSQSEDKYNVDGKIMLKYKTNF